MGYLKKTWINRQVEFPGRRKLTDTISEAEQVVDVERDEGTVIAAGDAFSAANMNDLESRIDIGKANKSTVVTATLLAASWVGTDAPYTYTLAVAGVAATSNQELLPGLRITAEQLEALQSANITDGGQAADSITLKAWGDVPTVDIPVRVILRGDA